MEQSEEKVWIQSLCSNEITFTALIDRFTSRMQDAFNGCKGTNLQNFPFSGHQ